MVQEAAASEADMRNHLRRLVFSCWSPLVALFLEPWLQNPLIALRANTMGEFSVRVFSDIGFDDLSGTVLAHPVNNNYLYFIFWVILSKDGAKTVGKIFFFVATGNYY